MKEVFHETPETLDITRCINCGIPLPEASITTKDHDSQTVSVVCQKCGYIQQLRPLA